MSAPYEVRLAAVLEKGEVIAVTGIPSDGVHVRYLCADLTCGECSVRTKGFDETWWCDERNAAADDDKAACMAFVPKKE